MALRQVLPELPAGHLHSRSNPACSGVLVRLPLRALLQPFHCLPDNPQSVWMLCTEGTHQGQVPQILSPDFKPFHGHSVKQHICDIFCSRSASMLTYSRLEMGSDGEEKQPVSWDS